LELTIASAMTATLLAAVSVVMRTGRTTWELHEADYVRIEAGHATLRHIVRQVRQAEEVAALSAANDLSGTLSLSMPDGTVWVWDHDATTGVVNFGVGSASSLLARNITSLQVEGYRADGATLAAAADEVRVLRISIGVTLPRESGAAQTMSSWVWVRTW
jgi:hypothetical protein